MAKTTVSRTPAFVVALEDALRRELPGAHVSSEQVRVNRYRFEVLWDDFSGVGHPERQQRVWTIAESVVPRQDLLDVGMILTISPDEFPQE